LKERCPEPLDDGGILARPTSYYDDKYYYPFFKIVNIMEWYD